jgi:hypothetical protein
MSEQNKPMSKIQFSLTQSTGTWLNDCLSPQHYYVSMELDDPDGKCVARVELSFEQMTRALMYHGPVPCTLVRFRDTTGKLASEHVAPVESVHDRMVKRMGDSYESLKKRLHDIQTDVYEMVNGDRGKGKKDLQSLLQDIEVIKSHFASNQTFVLKQSEEEVETIQSNAATQLGLLLASKGLTADTDTLRQLIGSSDKLLPAPEAVQAQDDYKLKERQSKPVSEMTAMQVADEINDQLRYLESLRPKGECVTATKLFGASAISTTMSKVVVHYISFQGASSLSLEEARMYLKYLLTVESYEEFKPHYHFAKDKP